MFPPRFRNTETCDLVLCYVVLLLARREGIDCEEDNNAILKSERIENTWNTTTLKEATIDII